MKYNLEFLNNYRTYINGPIQDDEGLFLYSIIKMIRPKVIVEFGFQEGYSARSFAKAMDKDCKLYSYDINEYSKNFYNNIVKEIKPKFFKLLIKGQQEFHPKDIEYEKIDFCFIDASHDLNLNKICFSKVCPSLNDGGIIGVHDTGFWTKEGFDEAPLHYKNKHRGIIKKMEKNARYMHSVVKAESKFADWLSNKMNKIQFHSVNYHRHGISLFQKEILKLEIKYL